MGKKLEQILSCIDYNNKVEPFNIIFRNALKMKKPPPKAVSNILQIQIDNLLWYTYNLQSLVQNQLFSSRHINIFKYSCFKSGYINGKPEKIDTTVVYSVRDSCNKHYEIEGCKNVAITRCSWCKKLCFKHFYEEYHYHNILKFV